MSRVHRLKEPLAAYRIGDPKGAWPVYSTEGASQISGRWHETGDRVIYASEHYSTAMLEKLVQWNGAPPTNQHWIDIVVPAGVEYEVADVDSLAGWELLDSEVAQAFGHRWYAERRSAILIVPSVVARMERNIVINAAHNDFPLLEPGKETPVWWDERLFR